MEKMEADSLAALVTMAASLSVASLKRLTHYQLSVSFAIWTPLVGGRMGGSHKNGRTLSYKLDLKRHASATPCVE